MSPASQCGGQLLIGHSLSEIIHLQSESFALALRFIGSRLGLVQAALGTLKGGGSPAAFKGETQVAQKLVQEIVLKTVG